MASIYQNNGPGRPPPQGSYRQTQTQLPPPPPPSQQGQYGGHGHHNFPPPPPPIHHPPYAGIGPPGPVPYNPIRPNNIHHGYGSAHMVQGPYGAPPPNAAPPPPQPQQPQQQHGFPPRASSYPPPPPPPPQNSQPPPPPPPPHQLHPSQPQPPPHHHPPYYPTSQFSHFAPPSQPPPSHDRPSSPPPPPPPSSPPPPPLPSSSLPPPPPPPQPNSSASASVNIPNSNPIKQHKENPLPTPLPNHGIRAPTKEANISGSGWGSSGSAQAKPLMTPSKHRHPSLPSVKPPQLPGGPQSAEPNRGETEEEKRLRKKREYEQRKEEEKQRREKEASAALLRKNQLGSSLHSAKVTAGATPRGATPRGDGRVERKPQYVGAEKIDNKLKKPTTFLCKLKFRNELPDPTAQPKLLSISTNKDRYAKYTITSLEKTHKPKLFVEPDLGIPLDLLDISVYNLPKVNQTMDPEDEELLRDDEMKTPNKLDGIRKKDRPTDKGVSWLVKTQYISPISLDTAKQPLTERQIKELREAREGRNIFLESLNNREQQIQAIEESFRVSKLRPVHQTKPGLEPEEILPLLPDFDRWDDQLVLATFDGEATADAENYGKLEASVRDELESRAVMKSFIHSSSDPTKPDKFLSYMVPGVEELMKDMYDEDEEEMSYTWLREYHWELRAEDANSPVTYALVFGEDGAKYLPLPTKLVLQKRRSKEGRSNEDIESQYPVPSRVTIRNRSLTQKEEEQRDSGRAMLMEGQANTVGNISGSKRMASDEDIHRSRLKLGRVEETGVEETDQNLSGDEYMSE